MSSKEEEYRRFRQTEVTRLPASIREHLFVQPTLSILVAEDRGQLSVAEEIPDTLSEATMPKLGIKSWHDSGRLRIIPADVPLAPAVAARLATPNRQHLATIPAWTEAEEPLFLHLLPFRNMSEISEIRMAVEKDTVKQTSSLLRGLYSRGLSNHALHSAKFLALEISNRLRMGSISVQMAIEKDGRVSVIDINPNLSTASLRNLTTD